MSDPGKAVFLSYASQDAEAAKKICDALRAAGVEVWFDQSELVGGDSWDAKIRGQIGSCGLFLPLISANTQARLEGYFRLEWKLAAQRTHTMAEEKTFLLPILLDGTRDAEAKVPPEFKAVQWTKLPGGETPPAFAARVQNLLSGSELEAGRPRPAERGEGAASPLRRGSSKWWWALPIFGGAMALLLVLKETRPAPLPSAASSVITAPPISEARRLIAQARPLLEGQAAAGNPSRDDLLFAEDLCRQALKLDQNDPVVWGACSEVNSQFFRGGIDRSSERIELARSQAERALNLAPQSFEARYAKACYLRGLDGAALTEAEKILRDLAAERPAAARVLISLGKVIWGALGPGRNLARADEALVIFDRAAAIPGDARAEALLQRGWLLFVLQRYREAESTFDEALRIQPAASGIRGLKVVLTTARGDLVAAKAALAEMSESSLRTDQGVGVAAVLWLLAREPDKCLAFMSSVSRDYVSGNTFTGTADGLRGDAYQLAGRTEAARNVWQTGLRVVERRLAEQPRDGALLGERAKLLAQLGERDAAVRALKLFEEIFPDPTIPAPSAHHFVAHVLLDPPEQAITVLESAAHTVGLTGLLRLGYQFDPLRGNPRFEALIKDHAATAPAASASPADDKSVAVLAFANLSDDKANEYFSDGISEELLNVLAKIPELKVTARTSSFHFKGKDTSVPEIAKQLGVAYVVEGSVRKSGDKVRITAQLIKAADGFHVWSDTFTRDLKDIFAVQDEIAGLIAKNLQLKMGMMVPAVAVDPEAFRLLLAGRAKIHEGGNANRAAAIAEIRRAVELAPNYAAAWAELARAFIQNARAGTVPLEVAYADARAAVQRAVALEPDSPEVLVALGWVRRTADWDWRAAEQAFRRALILQPNHAGVVADASVMLNNLGQIEESIQLGRRATELDPLNSEAFYNLSMFLGNARRLEESAVAAQRSVELAPGADGLHRNLSNTFADLGRFPEAAREAELEPDETNRVQARALILLRQGKKTEALVTAQVLERANNSLLDLSELYALAGDSDHAFATLEKAFAHRETGLIWLKVDSYLVSLYPDPRWPALLRKIGLADDQLK